MSTNKNSTINYGAETAYQDDDVVRLYEQTRFSGVLGRYKHRREQAAVRSLIELLPPNISVVDCPCGNGRWWPLLADRARSITAVDVSPAMLRAARARMSTMRVDVDLLEGNAEHLPLADESVDYVFSHALTKHLPIPVQYQVLKEFARVSRQGVICSFGIFSHMTYAFWRRRKLVESYPVLPEELQWMATAAGLRIVTLRKCTTPIGVEHTVLFAKN